MYISRLERGYRTSMFIMPFAGQGRDGKHHFNDHGHAKNFLRYLYSCSKAHGVNERTSHNLICEFEGGRVLSADFNTDAETMRADFSSRRFPETSAERELCDDGAYVLFAVSLPNGRALSNMFRSDGKELSIDHPLLDDLGNQNMSRMVSDFFGDGLVRVDAFDEVRPDNDVKTVDRIVQQFLSRKMGGEVMMSVSHRDQQDHNDLYHVHRLLKK